MNPQLLMKIMKTEDKRAMDVASELRISTATVMKYLSGAENMSRTYKMMIDEYVKAKSKELKLNLKSAS